jgi:multiple sugar transport system permease protein
MSTVVPIQPTRKNRIRSRNSPAAALPFLLPNFLGFLIFLLGPVIFTLVMSFSNWNLQQTIPFQWIGLKNFHDMMQDANFWLYAVNTVYFLIGIPFAIFGSLMIAILLNQQLRGMTLYRTLFYLPNFTNGIALFILWKAIYNPEYGPLNAMINGTLHALHISGSAPEWLNSTKNIFGIDVEKLSLTRKQWGLGARDAINFMGFWTSVGGANMLLYLAALTNMPDELIEAAQLDGAGKLAMFRHIIWPQLAPTTFFITIMSFIGGLQGGFETARVMTSGGPSGTTTTLSYYIYQKAFQEFDMGYASALSWVLFLVILVVTAVNWKFGNREESY